MSDNSYSLDKEIEKILKNDQKEEIVLFSNDGEPVRFKNLGLISHKGELYTILSSLDTIHGMAEGEKMVMSISDDIHGKKRLYLQTNERVISKIVKSMEKLYKKTAKPSSSLFENEAYDGLCM